MALAIWHTKLKRQAARWGEPGEQASVIMSVTYYLLCMLYSQSVSVPVCTNFLCLVFSCISFCVYCVSAVSLCGNEFCAFLCPYVFLQSVWTNVLLWLVQLSCVFVCILVCVCVCVCVVTVTMADTPDWYNQTTVNLAALHISPEPKTGHKPSSPYPWTPTLTRPIQQELTAPVHPRQAMLANCFFPLSVYPHFSFHPSLPPSLPSSSSLFIEPRPPRDIPFGWQPF